MQTHWLSFYLSIWQNIEDQTQVLPVIVINHSGQLCCECMQCCCREKGQFLTTKKEAASNYSVQRIPYDLGMIWQTGYASKCGLEFLSKRSVQWFPCRCIDIKGKGERNAALRRCNHPLYALTWLSMVSRSFPASSVLQVQFDGWRLVWTPLKHNAKLQLSADLFKT